MSQEASTIGSTGSSAAPPPPAPAAAPSSTPAPPTAVPVAPQAPSAVAQPAVAPTDAVAPPVPGAPASKPTSLNQVFEKYHQDKAAIAANEAAPPPEVQPLEVQPQPEAVPEAPLEAAEPTPEAVIEEPVAEPAALAPETSADTEEFDLDTILTPEQINEKYQRKLSTKDRTELAQRETHRGELLQTVQDLGGETGVKLAKEVSALLWKDYSKETYPTEEAKSAALEADAEALLDLIFLPENAGAIELGRAASTHFVHTALYDETHGKEFASGLISGEWGKRPDGTPYDFGGMQPLELVDTLVKAAQSGVINLEFVKTEMEGRTTPEPSARELELQRENEELRAGRQTKEAEQVREREQAKTQYVTQAKGYVSRTIMSEIMPLAEKANWAAKEGEEGPQVERKKLLGRLVTADINSHIMGAPDALSPEYSVVLDMINNGTAFDATGHPTPRFAIKLKPLQTMAKARFNETLRVLSSEFKFAAENSRAAQLVKQNGGKVGAPPAEQPAPPPLAVPPPPPTNRPLTSEEQLAKVRADYRAKKQEQQASVGVL